MNDDSVDSAQGPLAELGFVNRAQLDAQVVEDLHGAYRLATVAHEGQTRGHGAAYIGHPVAVLRILLEEFSVRDRDGLVAALLHDVVEDSDTTSEQLEAQFGAEVAAIVRAMTKDPSLPRHERDQGTVDKLARAGTLATQVKLADRLHNLREARLHPDPDFRVRYLAAAKKFYFPLAEKLGEPWTSAYRTALAALE